MGRIRVLFLASFFPKPDNPWMGTWALSQAQALARQNIDLQVVSFTSWVPKSLAVTAGAKAYAQCPLNYAWAGQIQAHYPRWLYYPVPPLKQWAYVQPTPYLKLAGWSAKRSLFRLIEKFQPDVIFCHHSLPNGWLITQLATQSHIPLITLDHDFDEIADCDRLPQRQAAMQIVAARAWAMLAVSNRMQLDLQRLFPKANALTLHNGVDLPSAATRARARPSSLQGKTIILSCALFAERKGIPLLVEAFSRVASRYPDAVLRIIGDGSEKERIQHTIAKFGLEARVQLVGKKPHSEVIQEMVWADCFALVGWDEPFATVYLEAMASGKPIVCCTDGGINDVFTNGVQGYAIPPKDVAATAEAINRLLSRPQERIEMGNRARQLVKQSLTWDAKATELLKLFETAIANQAHSTNLI